MDITIEDPLEDNAAKQPRKSSIEDRIKAILAGEFEFLPAQIPSPLLPDEEKQIKVEGFNEYEFLQSKRLHCTVCNQHIGTAPINQFRRYVHPELNVMICLDCYKFYGSGSFDKDEDGSEIYCKWCAQGGHVMCCSTCPLVFCQQCVRRNLGSAKLQAIRGSDAWSCFKCAPEQITSFRLICYVMHEYTRNEIDIATRTKCRDIAEYDIALCCKTRRKRKSNSDNEDNEEFVPPVKTKAKRRSMKVAAPPAVEIPEEDCKVEKPRAKPRPKSRQLKTNVSPSKKVAKIVSRPKLAPALIPAGPMVLNMPSAVYPPKSALKKPKVLKNTTTTTTPTAAAAAAGPPPAVEILEEDCKVEKPRAKPRPKSRQPKTNISPSKMDANIVSPSKLMSALLPARPMVLNMPSGDSPPKSVLKKPKVLENTTTTTPTAAAAAAAGPPPFSQTIVVPTANGQQYVRLVRLAPSSSTASTSSITPALVTTTTTTQLAKLLPSLFPQTNSAPPPPSSPSKPSTVKRKVVRNDPRLQTQWLREAVMAGRSCAATLVQTFCAIERDAVGTMRYNELAALHNRMQQALAKCSNTLNMHRRDMQQEFLRFLNFKGVAHSTGTPGRSENKALANGENVPKLHRIAPKPQPQPKLLQPQPLQLQPRPQPLQPVVEDVVDAIDLCDDDDEEEREEEVDEDDQTTASGAVGGHWLAYGDEQPPTMLPVPVVLESEASGDDVDEDFEMAMLQPEVILSVDKEPNAEVDTEPNAVVINKEPNAEVVDTEPNAEVVVDKEPNAEAVVDKEPNVEVIDKESNAEVVHKEPNAEVVDRCISGNNGDHVNELEPEPEPEVVDVDVMHKVDIPEDNLFTASKSFRARCKKIFNETVALNQTVGYSSKELQPAEFHKAIRVRILVDRDPPAKDFDFVEQMQTENECLALPVVSPIPPQTECETSETTDNNKTSETTDNNNDNTVTNDEVLKLNAVAVESSPPEWMVNGGEAGGHAVEPASLSLDDMIKLYEEGGVPSSND